MDVENNILEILKAKKDGTETERKIGLMLPGGGMSGVFSGGVVQVFEEMGLADCFDYIYGYSAGAFSAAYMLSKRTKLGTSIYWKDLCGFKFIKPWKLKNSMNMKYFCDEVVREKKKLDLKKIKSSNTILKVFVTNTETGKTEYFTNKDDVDFITLLKASCSFPGFTNPVEINGNKYVDGNAIKLTTIDEAIEDGCTDLIIVPTLPKDYYIPKVSIIYSISGILCFSYGKEFRKKYQEQARNYNNDLKRFYDKADKINVYVIAPDYYLLPAETSAKKLKKFEVHGIQKARDFLKQV